ncbi:MAG: NAD-dependent succinate-semialdehyde dehydrogenase [Acidobacteriota bacterium]
MALLSIDPTNGELVASYPEMTLEEAFTIVERASNAFHDWRRSTFDARASVLRAVAAALRTRKAELARLMALEMGKPLAQGEGEVEKCAAACEFFADRAAELLADQDVPTEAARSFVAFKPLGVVLGVMPWNFPLWQVIRYTAPALMAGNTTVLKHASNVTGCALALEEIFDRAGAPPGVFRTLRLGSADIALLVDHPHVAAVTLTGSTPAGRSVAARAGQALKKTVLELGGSDPYVILDDADLEKAVATCVYSRLINSGQSCVAAKRFICTELRAEEVERLFAKMMAAKTMGDPLTAVDVGPQARLDLRDELARQVRASVDRGAHVLVGGVVPEGPGSFYPPTVLAGVTPGMPAYDEELFGPVAAIIRARSEDDAVRIANDTAFGLGAAVFTKDVPRGARIAADALDAGNCFVNDFVRSDPRLPFGGIKQSGYGRELSAFGIREFVNIKTVWITSAGST